MLEKWKFVRNLNIRKDLLSYWLYEIIKPVCLYAYSIMHCILFCSVVFNVARIRRRWISPRCTEEQFIASWALSEETLFSLRFFFILGSYTVAMLSTSSKQKTFRNQENNPALKNSKELWRFCSFFFILGFIALETSSNHHSRKFFAD